MVATAVGLLLLLTTAAIQSPASAQFCPPSYRNKNPEHTACKRRNMWCRIKAAGVHPKIRASILKMHNDFRSQTALGKLPGFQTAADMQELLWDDELATVAQAHATLCTTPDGDLKNDKVEDRFTDRFEQTGQNTAWLGRPGYVEGPNWTWAMDGWFTKEYKLYPPRDVSKFAPVKDAKIGHFTQIIWAKTHYVGCGYVYYSVDGALYPHMKQYTCNYGPSGNYMGQPIYQEGPTCSACPNSTQCDKATGLCITSRSPNWKTPAPTRSRRPPVTSRPQPPGLRCPPCPCLPSTPSPPAYPTQRRNPPYAQDPAPRPYPLPYDPRLGGGLPRCKDMEGYKPGKPGQPPCVEGDFGGVGSGTGSDDSDGAHSGRPGRDGDIWLPFALGVVTGLAVVALCVLLLLCLCNTPADHMEAKLSTGATVTPAY
ncbi:venom allergen-1-like [Dermacentor andersoni]|uniref:venom allergen-1-like n=1 Tax=Dermacentor andersoni TaxID=34620 RepID=UPI0024178279|nr:cysteine-rich venom protein-like [Dermacentor andersoni]